MASKLRNMFHKHKKQETTENVNLERYRGKEYTVFSRRTEQGHRHLSPPSSRGRPDSVPVTFLLLHALVLDRTSVTPDILTAMSPCNREPSVVRRRVSSGHHRPYRDDDAEDEWAEEDYQGDRDAREDDRGEECGPGLPALSLIRRFMRWLTKIGHRSIAKPGLIGVSEEAAYYELCSNYHVREIVRIASGAVLLRSLLGVISNSQQILTAAKLTVLDDVGSR
ncbi:hypothetical protein AAG570_004804 [Ranatra chinensis]|uniref:Uncharacterized protein n=1 Tax=Ranatra chinensis TaxID=642074 RepID=A0ABD0YNR4_9HEMI